MFLASISFFTKFLNSGGIQVYEAMGYTTLRTKAFRKLSSVQSTVKTPPYTLDKCFSVYKYYLYPTTEKHMKCSKNPSISYTGCCILYMYKLELSMSIFSRCFLGLFFIIPCTDSYTKVDLRTVSFDVPPQEVRFSYTTLRGQSFHVSP